MIVLVNNNLIYQLPEITFNLNDSASELGLSGTYTCQEGMTWSEFVNSDYNTIGLVSDSSSVYIEDDCGNLYSPHKSGSPVSPTDVIESITYKIDLI